MRKWLWPAIACGVAVALAVSGCGRGGEDDPSDQSKAIGDGKAKGEIKVWAMGAEGEKLGKFAKGFMKDNPDAKVKVTPVPWDGAHDKISNAIASGKTPDVALIGTTWMGEFAKAGGLDATPGNMMDADEYYEGSWDTTVLDDVSYGVPWYSETRLFYVNKKVAKKAGVTEAPGDWQEFKTAVEKMHTKGGAKWGAGLPPGGIGSWQAVLPFVWQNGGEIAKGEKFTFDSPKVTEALEYYDSFFEEGLAPKDPLANGDLESQFIKGEIGVFPSGPWHMGLLADQDAADKYDLWHMPENETATSFVGGGNLAAFKDAENRDGAWKFIDYLSKPEVQADWFATIGDLPAVKAAWDEPALKDDPRLAAFGKQLEDAKSPPTIPTWEQVAKVFDDALEELATTGIPASKACANTQSKAESIGTGI